MSTWHPFRYRDFHDEPRCIVTSDGSRTVLLDCPFDDALDDYPGTYEAYLIPALAADELAGSWMDLERRATRCLGSVDMPRSAFDDTLRKQVDWRAFVHLLPVD